jgi:exo-1,4-beta-D-glucosaminidase
MSGPYDWVPPAYWLTDKNKLGGGWGYNTETGPGPAIPPVESLKKFIPADQLWPLNDDWFYHAGLGKFQQIDIMSDAINQRYGSATDLNDFERKTQAIAYEGERAMFEAYTRNKYTSTGVIQWMLNNAWPSIIWHLYDYYLDPAAGYFGTKKANEPLHILYGYDDRGVYVINSTYQDVKGLKAKATVLNFDLTPKFTKEAPVDLAADGVSKALDIPELADLSTTYFVRLELFDAAGKRASDNFYWLSTKPDVYDWAKSSFYNTPVTQHADVTMLNQLPKVDLIVTQGRTEHIAAGAKAVLPSQGATVALPRPAQNITHVTVKNPSKSLAFMVRLRLLKGGAGTAKNPATNPGNASSLNPTAAGGDDVLPIMWDDNYFTLLPGEQREITATYAAADLGTAQPVIAVEGWNAVARTVSATAKASGK